MVKIAASYAFSAPQIVTDLHVKSGDHVKKGQRLATLDSAARFQAALETAQAEHKLALSRQSQAQARLTAGEVEAAAAATARAQEDHDYAALELHRNEQLHTQAAVAKTHLDRWESEVRIKKSVHQQMQRTQSALESSLNMEIKTTTSAVEAAMAAVRRAETEMTLGYVIAPRDGRVLKTLLHAGEIATTPLLEFAGSDLRNVLAEVDETDIRFIKIGASAKVTSRALANPLTGKVIDIGLRVKRRDALNADPAARSDGRVVEVTVRLDDPTPVTGLTHLECDVVIQAPD
ncbi:MAG: HlyD family efflux transporter periplasmic adaptor subunit [Verrucomicrobiaceae bacterium]|nr:HlyD family efflux transporter periplasmic adaptor subunit [Verrucomicrobiaceae bacterium]